ncbi:MAG TPA: hypothetical protein QGG37_12610, partial [Chloroflexota bacterium]|nr:hypothetical protein [Chloroflexota bacterium]
AVRRLGRRFYGLERFMVGASTDAMAVLAMLLSLFSAVAGLLLVAAFAGLGAYFSGRSSTGPAAD